LSQAYLEELAASCPGLKVPVLRIRDPVPFWPLDPGSRIGFFRIPDLESRIPNPYIWEHGENYLRKNFKNSLKFGPNVFIQHLKNKIIFNFVKFLTTKKIITNFFSPLSFLLFLDPGSEMGKNQDPG
jgi:hypothetical protein